MTSSLSGTRSNQLSYEPAAATPDSRPTDRFIHRLCPAAAAPQGRGTQLIGRPTASPAAAGPAVAVPNALGVM
jgi:hypothetical protein